MVRVDLLGSGNAFLPSGRHHSFTCIDRHMIIDAPPTCLASLRRAGISVADIDTILITHVHGDHVFGFPFILLERKYISDREGLRPLTVAGSSGVKERLVHLCHLAYPGSLDSILETIEWVDIPKVENWSFERFEVLHDPEVDPHGWRLENENGISLLHSGDSGPCEELWSRVGGVDLAIVEMGVPQWVPTEHHHKPADIERLANENQDTTILVTHTFIDADYEIITTQVPDFPSNVIHGDDEMALELLADSILLI